MSNPLPPLSKGDLAALRADIERRGVIVAILVRPDGSIIDGYHRAAIARDLGIDCPTEVIDCDAGQARELALALNVHRRQMTSKQKNEAVKLMRKSGLSMRTIASQLGIGTATVSRATSGGGVPNGTAPRSPGRRQGYRPTPTEHARITDEAVRLYGEGHTQQAIADALGITKDMVGAHLRRAGITGEKNRKGHDRPPPKIEWRDPPAQTVEPPAPYTVSTTLSLLRSLVANLRHDNAENRFANDVADAVSVNDREWLHGASETIGEAQTYLARLSSVLEDTGARTRAMVDPERRDDVARLRMIRGTG